MGQKGFCHYSVVPLLARSQNVPHCAPQNNFTAQSPAREALTSFMPTQAARHSLSPGCPPHSFSCLPGANSLGSTGGPYHWAGKPWLCRGEQQALFCMPESNWSSQRQCSQRALGQKAGFLNHCLNRKGNVFSKGLGCRASGSQPQTPFSCQPSLAQPCPHPPKCSPGKAYSLAKCRP